MRKLTVLLVAVAGALSAFLITMVTTPPTTEAAQPRPSINIGDLTIQANLPVAGPADAFWSAIAVSNSPAVTHWRWGPPSYPAKDHEVTMEFLPFDMGRSHLIDVLGYAASGATLCAFAQKQMLPMRVSAMAANLFFIGYGAFGLIYPVLLLHLVLLPLNAGRLAQQIDQERRARSMKQKVTLVEEWQRNRERFSHAAANLMPEQTPRAANSQAIRYRSVPQAQAMS